MCKDTFLSIEKILGNKSILVRVINGGGVPYSLIYEYRNGGFYEIYNTPTNGDGGASTEAEMVAEYLKRSGKIEFSR